MTTRVLFALIFGASAFACGGTDDTPRPARPVGDVPPGVCRPIVPLIDTPDDGGQAADCGSLNGYEFFILNTFEAGQTQANWYFNNDRTADQEPPPDAQGVPTTKIPGGRCVGAETTATSCPTPETPRGECNDPMPIDSRYAMNIRSGLLTNNGGVFGSIRPKKDCISPITVDDKATPDVNEFLETNCKFKPGPPEIGPCSIGEGPSPSQLGCTAAEDTSDWEGVMLWARVGPNSPSSIRVRASDPFTDDKACNCNPYTNQNDASDGCDKFGKFVNIDNSFRAYFVPFDDMQQGGWGLVSPGLDRSNLFEIVVEYGRGAWDLWIDDVAYYRRRP